MGNCTAVIKKKNVRPYGRSTIVQISLSSSYATNGDTVPLAILGIGNRLSALLGVGVTTPAGHAVEYIPAANEYTAPKLRVRDVASGAEISNATNLSAQSIVVEAIASPYK